MSATRHASLVQVQSARKCNMNDAKGRIEVGSPTPDANARCIEQNHPCRPRYACENPSTKRTDEKSLVNTGGKNANNSLESGGSIFATSDALFLRGSRCSRCSRPSCPASPGLVQPSLPSGLCPAGWSRRTIARIGESAHRI